MGAADAARPRPGWIAGFFVGVGLQFLAALPAAIAQALVELENLLLVPVGLPVLTAGRSVVHLFESTVHAVCGDRPDTMLSNAWWFLLLGAAQTTLLAALLAWRRRRAGSWRDPIVHGVLAFVLVNAALAWDWPWWGT